MMEAIRWLLLQEKDKAAQQPDRMKEFAYGLIYDALGWTDKPYISLGQFGVIGECVQIAEQPTVSSEDVITIRQKLLDGGFSISPPIKEET